LVVYIQTRTELLRFHNVSIHIYYFWELDSTRLLATQSAKADPQAEKYHSITYEV